MSTATGRYFDAELHRALKRVYWKTLGLKLIAGTVSFLAVVALGFLLLFLWTVITQRPSLFATLIVSRAALIGLFALFAFFVIYPLLRTPGFKRMALEIEQHKDFKHIIASGYEFSARDDVSERYAPELVREVIRQAVDSIGRIEVRDLFLARRQLAYVPIAYAALFAIMVIAIASPANVMNAGKRVVKPHDVADIDRDANLYGTPGNVSVLSGSDVEVGAVDLAGSEDPVELVYNLSEGFWKTEPTVEKEMLIEGETVPKFAYTFRDVRNGIVYYFQVGEQRSPEYRIDVVHKPIVTDLQIKLTPPAYTGEQPELLVDSGGNVHALEGTQVEISARSNNDLRYAWVRFDERPARSLDVNGREFAFDFTALEDGSYSIILEDQIENRTDEPLLYSVEVYQDNAPVIDVLAPGADATLPRNFEVDVAFIASDDYGVTKAEIHYRKNGEEHFRRKPIALGEEAGTREVAIEHKWDLGDVTLFPGNYVEYYIQVEDNNTVTGPGIAKSRIYHISVPTMAELYDRVKEEDTSRTDMLEEARRESEALRERMEKLSREFKKSQDLDWAQKKELDKALSSQEAVQEKLEEIQKSLEETLKSLSDNKMTSQDIGEKMEEIQKLLEDINDEKLNKYVDDLRKAMEKMNPRDIERAMENMEMSAEDLLKSLERTENLLKEIQKEQQVEEMVRKTQDLMNKQQELNDKTTDADQNDQDAMDELSEEQSELSEEAKQLEKELRELAKQMQGEQQDGEQQDGEQQDGEQQDGEQQDGEQQDGEQQDGEQQDGEQQDGEQQDGEQQDGEQQDGEQQDGEQQDSEQNESPQDPELAEKMQKMAEELKKRQTSKSMKDASDQLKKQQKPGAQQNQQQAMEDLIALFEKMMDMQMEMQMSSNQRAADNLQRLAKSTLALSFKQEELANRLRSQVQQTDPGVLKSLAKEQLSYTRAVGQIADELEFIAQKTMAVNPDLIRMLGETIASMNSAMLFLEQDKAFMSTNSANSAVENLNTITIELLSAAKMCSTGMGGGQGSQMSLMQQMMQGQRDVMQQTEEMMAMRAMREKMMQERQSQIERLMGQQRALRDMAEELNKGGKDGERLLGRMDKIVDEMDEVIRDLESGSIDEDTVRKEQRILSRMLDAQRSIHQRDYEKKRESMSADDVFSDTPDTGGQELSQQELRDEIRRMMALKAPGEFEELIKLYFRALAEEAPQESAQ